ncbi:PAS domain S-box protein [Aeromonas jandaei]
MKDEPFSIRLQHELDHLKAIFNETDAYLFTKDLAGRYTYANQAVLDLFGCTLAELQGQDDRAFFDLEFSDAVKRNEALLPKSAVRAYLTPPQVTATLGAV